MKKLEQRFCHASSTDCLTITGPDRTGPIMLIILFLVSHSNFLFVPCGRLSWLPVSFLLHYRIVSLLSCSVCLSVCVCVTFIHSVKTNKHILKNFSPSGSPTILVFTAHQHTDVRYWYSNSVRPSVRHVPVSDENGLTYCHSFFAVQ